jgi:hypothetical protein
MPGQKGAFRQEGAVTISAQIKFGLEHICRASAGAGADIWSSLTAIQIGPIHLQRICRLSSAASSNQN